MSVKTDGIVCLSLTCFLPPFAVLTPSSEGEQNMPTSITLMFKGKNAKVYLLPVYSHTVKPPALTGQGGIGL